MIKHNEDCIRDLWMLYVIQCMMRLARKDTATVFKWEQGVTETKETEAGEIIAVKQICSKKLLKETSTWCSYTLLCPHYVNGFSCSDGPTITSPPPCTPTAMCTMPATTGDPSCAALVSSWSRRNPCKAKIRERWNERTMETIPVGIKANPH